MQVLLRYHKHSEQICLTANPPKSIQLKLQEGNITTLPQNTYHSLDSAALTLRGPFPKTYFEN
jgi:hypothetical protein